jgi:hypothetical protein
MWYGKRGNCEHHHLTTIQDAIPFCAIIDPAKLRDESNAKQKKRNQIICKYPQLLCGIY